jgi:V8-like Glu-specific endopeptidase
MRRKPSNGHTCRAVSGVIRYGLVVLAVSANVSAQDRPQGCPVELGELRAAARAIANEPLRRELMRMADARPQDAVLAAGGLEAYGKQLRERIARLEAQAGAAGRSDAERGAQVFERLLRAARCIVPESDPRQPLCREGAGVPVSAVGLVRRMLGQGSGTLVGRCVVVTSEHVVSRGGSVPTKVGDAAYFYSGVGNIEGGFAEWTRAEIVALGPRQATNQAGDDWAILRLDRPLGDKYGTVRLGTAMPAALPARALWALGFPADGAAVSGGHRVMWSHKPCGLVAAERNAWLVSCAGNRGQSGGPILAPGESGGPVLVAMITAMRGPAPLGTQASAGADGQPLGIATAIGAFEPQLREALKQECPGSPLSQRLR